MYIIYNTLTVCITILPSFKIYCFKVRRPFILTIKRILRVLKSHSLLKEKKGILLWT